MRNANFTDRCAWREWRGGGAPEKWNTGGMNAPKCGVQSAEFGVRSAESSRMGNGEWACRRKGLRAAVAGKVVKIIFTTLRGGKGNLKHRHLIRRREDAMAGQALSLSMNRNVSGMFALTPTQWLPKPATSQFPERRRTLRATWSPRRGRRSGATAVQGFNARDSASGNSPPGRGGEGSFAGQGEVLLCGEEETTGTAAAFLRVSSRRFVQSAQSGSHSSPA
jgi:hypothetical protein